MLPACYRVWRRDPVAFGRANPNLTPCLRRTVVDMKRLPNGQCAPGRVKINIVTIANVNLVGSPRYGWRRESDWLEPLEKVV